MELFGVAHDGDDSKWNFTGSFVPWHNRQFDTNVDASNLWTYQLEELLGIRTPEAMERVEQFLYDDAHHAMKPLPGAVEAHEQLRSFCRLELVTNRCTSTTRRTTELVQMHFSGISNHHFANGYTKYSDQYPKVAKADICSKHKLQVITEDSTNEALKAVEAGMYAILIPRQWHTELPTHSSNRLITPEAAHDDHLPELERVKQCWLEVPEIVARIQRIAA